MQENGRTNKRIRLRTLHGLDVILKAFVFVELKHGPVLVTSECGLSYVLLTHQLLFITKRQKCNV